MQEQETCHAITPVAAVYLLFTVPSLHFSPLLSTASMLWPIIGVPGAGTNIDTQRWGGGGDGDNHGRVGTPM